MTVEIHIASAPPETIDAGFVGETSATGVAVSLRFSMTKLQSLFGVH